MPEAGCGRKLVSVDAMKCVLQVVGYNAWHVCHQLQACTAPSMSTSVTAACGLPQIVRYGGLRWPQATASHRKYMIPWEF